MRLPVQAQTNIGAIAWGQIVEHSRFRIRSAAADVSCAGSVRPRARSVRLGAISSRSASPIQSGPIQLGAIQPGAIEPGAIELSGVAQ